METQLRSSATIRKRDDSESAVITVGVEIKSGPFSVESKFEQPVRLEPTEKCRALYGSLGALFKGCEGAAQSGVFFANNKSGGKCGTIVFTKFDGVNLPPDCGTGFAIAATIACLRALDQAEATHQLDMDGWSVI